MTGGEAIVSGLVAHGVDTVFGLPGAQIYGLFDAFHQAQLKVIGARHEQACGYMAYGYARSTGKPGVFSVVPGPGVLNAGAALLTAFGAQRAGAVPDRPGADAVPRQGPRPSARDAGPARDPAHLREMGRPHRISRHRADAWSSRAFQEMLSGRRGPVALEMPWDVFTQRAEVGASKVFDPFPAPQPDPDRIKDAAALIAASKTADDLRRQRRDPCARGNPRTGRDDRCAGRGVPQRPRHRLQRA